ncbi:hypothetical protein BDN70DRAFT_882439 [Pholiota conissans]|uniref:Uncharacterized protein n=1 Tax=Pholiota conissans TaxID=109636 RepID=A0A9P6CQZ6_9AGAR|nr:hypothetical protein BDN70DRAFT_882439 [Pholiota conissans]
MELCSDSAHSCEYFHLLTASIVDDPIASAPLYSHPTLWPTVSYLYTSHILPLRLKHWIFKTILGCRSRMPSSQLSREDCATRCLRRLAF